MKIVAKFIDADTTIELDSDESMGLCLDKLYTCAAIQDRSALALEIFGASYWWLIDDTQKPLRSWLPSVESAASITVCVRRNLPIIISPYAEERFQISEVWQPVRVANQTAFGISKFLGALYMIAEMSSTIDCLRLSAYVASRATHALQRAPLFYSLYALFSANEKPTTAMQGMISQGLYSIFRGRTQCTEAEVFEHSLEIWTQLLQEAEALPAAETASFAEMVAEKAWLTCSLTHARLNDPVRTTAATPTVAQVEAERAVEMQTDAPVPLLSKQLYSREAVVARQRGGKMFLEGNPFANCNIVPDAEYAAYLCAQPKGSYLIRLNAAKVDIVLESLKATQIKTPVASLPIAKRFFTIVHPLALRSAQPPCLTWLNAKQLGVYKGQGKGSQTDVFVYNFTTAALQEQDPDTLADLLDIGQSADNDAADVDAVPLREAVVVLLDVSTSMGNSFTDGVGDEDSDSDDEVEASLDRPSDDVRDTVVEAGDDKLLDDLKEVDWLLTAKKMMPRCYFNRLLTVVSIAQPRFADLFSRRAATVKKIVEQAKEKAIVKKEEQREGKKEEAVKEEKIKVDVKILTGRTISVEVYPTDHARVVGEKIGDELGCPPNACRLIFAGKSLEPDKKLSDYNITNGATLHLVLRLSRDEFESHVRGPRTIQILRGSVRQHLNWGSVNVDGGESAAKLYLLVYEKVLSRIEDPRFCLWYAMEHVGDGQQCGHILYGEQTVSRIPSDGLVFLSNIPLAHPSREAAEAKHEKRQRNRLSRITVAKHMFETFCDRLRSYRLPTHLGLVTFGSEVTYACPIAAAFRRFRRTSDAAVARGDTHLYDALILASNTLVEYRLKLATEEARNQCRLRIVVLSDGQDRGSTASALAACRHVWQSNVICDVIQIGKFSDASSELHATADCSGGYTFAPTTATEAMYPFELETMLSSEQRVLNRSRSLPSAWDMSVARGCRQICSRDAGAPPPRKVPAELSAAATTLDAALARDVSAASASSSSSSGEAIRHLMIQLRALHTTPHPQIDIYPCDSNLLYWRFVIHVPADTENTPYAGGTFLLYVAFPANFPRSPPEIRFITPIRHVNVNVYGRVCHSILAENWHASRSMLEVLSCIYGLLLCADVESPIDSALAQQYHTDAGVYESVISDHVQKHARTTTRLDHRIRLTGEEEADDADMIMGTPKKAKHDDTMCAVCLSERRGIVLHPCSHMALCTSCGEKWSRACPICRKPVTSVSRVFLS